MSRSVRDALLLVALAVGWHPAAYAQPLPPLDSSRAESLLAYLLLHRDAPQPRQHLAFLLWPGSTEGQAQTNLRKVLHTLRLFGESFRSACDWPVRQKEHRSTTNSQSCQARG